KRIKIIYEWTPGDNIPAPVKTECLVTFDKSKLYIAFKCFDPEPGKIRAHLMDRDSMDTFVQDDNVGFMLDTFNDERRAFQFRVNPLGVQADAIFSEMEGYEDFSWDAIWKSAGKITGFGYVVELAIPFNQLRFPRGKGVQTWGFEANRSYPRTVRHRMTSHVIDRNRDCNLCQFNKLTGFAGISPGKNIEITPTLTAGRTDNREDFPGGAMAAGEIDVQPGITARWGITPNLMLNAAVNPDFSQVEADVAQLEVNTRFALRYPEKRPFFLESADLFLTPMEAVFTRTVYDPVWGAKLSGKVGKNALGFFAAQDRYNNLVFPSNQGSAVAALEENVLGGVFRYRRDVGEGSTMGLLYTGRSSDNYYNHVAGVDGFFRLTKTKTVNVQYLHSRTDYPGEVAQSYGQEDEPFDGHALYAQFKHRGRNMYYLFQYEDFSTGFRADSGFIPRVDMRKMIGMIHPVIWGKEGGWFERIGLRVLGTNITDGHNNLTDRDLEFAASINLPLQTYVFSAFHIQKEFFNGITYDKNRVEFLMEMKPVGGLRYTIYSAFGDAIDYTNSRPAKSLLLNPSVEFGIGKHLNLNVNHLFERLSLDGEKIYTANLLQAKLIYNFNVRTFARVILQYTDINRNPDLYPDSVEPETNAFFTQFLFSYKINPQTVLFLGYSDNQLGFRGIDITRTDRTFFLKLGYALVM
ncbi:MAG: carbohydrate binding family 9 domain-containing protein, partial [bacterium]|nr:carbohydrate binding family 9 domain-containing protein [bacterium]